jgi:ketosteroid isomerase-like protein
MGSQDLIVDPKKPFAGTPASSTPKPSPEGDLGLNSTVDEFFTRLRSDMRHPSPSQESVEAAMQTMQRLAAEAAEDRTADPAVRGPLTCETCGHQNRPGNQFCGMCGLPLALSVASDPSHDSLPGLNLQGPAASLPAGQHHYHHHYHHYVTPGHDASFIASPAGPVPAAPNLTRPRAPGGATMNRVETAVRKVMQDWVFACNSKQLDDLVSTYSTDALVLRPNHPAVRGTPAIREFFFAALDSGVGDVEIDPIRLDVTGDVGYEAGRYKMLVPVAVSKRREERGKYLTLLARQPNGEWRIVSDCWSSDLSLAKSSEPDPKAATPAVPTKPTPPRRI